MKSSSNYFMEYSRNFGRTVCVDDSESVMLVQALMIAERRRRIYQRLEEFERMNQARVALEMDEGASTTADQWGG